MLSRILLHAITKSLLGSAPQIVDLRLKLAITDYPNPYGILNSAQVDYPKLGVTCLDLDSDDDDMVMSDRHIDNSHHKEQVNLENENDSNLMHTNMDAEENGEETPVVSSMTASGRFMHAKPPTASSPANISSPGNLAATPPWSGVDLEGINGRAGSPRLRSPCDQGQLSGTTYGHGVSGSGPTACGTSQRAKLSSAGIPSTGNPPGCIPGFGVVLHGQKGLKVVGPPLNVRNPNHQAHLSRAACGHGVSPSSEPGPSNVDTRRPHSRTPNWSANRCTRPRAKTKTLSRLERIRRAWMKDEQGKRHSAEELKRRDRARKVQGLPTMRGAVRHIVHSSPSTAFPSLLGASRKQAIPGQHGTQLRTPTVVPSHRDNEKKSSQLQGSKNIRACPIHGPVSSTPLIQERHFGASVHQIGAAIAKSVLEGHKNLGPVKNETNTSPVNRAKKNQLSLVQPVYDTPSSTPRDAVTQTLKSYDYHFQVALRELQERRREQAQKVRGTRHWPGQFRPDIRAYNAVRDAHEDVHRRMVVGDIPGVEIGDRFKFRHQMAVVGLHHFPNCGIAYASPPPDNIPTASAVVYVPRGGYADNVDNGHEVIYTGQGGRLDRTQAAPFVEHQKPEKGNAALLMNFDRDVPVRMIRAHANLTQASNNKTLGYTYDGLYSIDTVKFELGVGGYNVYKFFLTRLDNQPPIPPCIEGCTTHPWNGGQGAFTPLPLQVVAPEYEHVLGVAEDDDLEDGLYLS